ncbi:MAG: AAA family ATPase [Nitrosopumilus sp.]
MAWIMDMYSWKLLFEIKLMDPEITGIVFLDEIEQHLHPIWQSEIVNRLSEQFKNIQFITSTHSPLVALNSFSSNHENFNSKLFVLDWYKNQVNISEISEPLHELDYDQLLASEAFGHMYNLNPIVSELLKEMSKLASIDNPDNFQIAKLKKVKQGLKNIIYPTGATLIEREVERDYFQELVKKNKELKALLKTKNDKN